MIIWYIENMYLKKDVYLLTYILTKVQNGTLKL